jgi:hypothetical protein
MQLFWQQASEASIRRDLLDDFMALAQKFVCSGVCFCSGFDLLERIKFLEAIQAQIQELCSLSEINDLTVLVFHRDASPGKP